MASSLVPVEKEAHDILTVVEWGMGRKRERGGRERERERGGRERENALDNQSAPAATDAALRY